MKWRRQETPTKTAKLLHLSLLSSWSHFIQQMNDSLDLLKPAKFKWPRKIISLSSKSSLNIISSILFRNDRSESGGL